MTRYGVCPHTTCACVLSQLECSQRGGLPATAGGQGVGFAIKLQRSNPGAAVAALALRMPLSLMHEPILTQPLRLQTMAPFRDSVTSLALDGPTILAGSVDGTVRSFDIRLGAGLVPTSSLRGWDPAACVQRPARGQLLIPPPRVWAVAPPPPGNVTSDDLGAPVTSIRLTADGNCLLASTIGAGIRLIDRASGTHLADFSGHTCAAVLAARAESSWRHPRSWRRVVRACFPPLPFPSPPGTRLQRWSAGLRRQTRSSSRARRCGGAVPMLTRQSDGRQRHPLHRASRALNARPPHRTGPCGSGRLSTGRWSRRCRRTLRGRRSAGSRSTRPRRVVRLRRREVTRTRAPPLDPVAARRAPDVRKAVLNAGGALDVRHGRARQDIRAAALMGGVVKAGQRINRTHRRRRVNRRSAAADDDDEEEEG